MVIPKLSVVPLGLETFGMDVLGSKLPSYCRISLREKSVQAAIHWARQETEMRPPLTPDNIASRPCGFPMLPSCTPTSDDIITPTQTNQTVAFDSLRCGGVVRRFYNCG